MRVSRKRPESVPEGTHYCLACKETLPVADFYARNGKPVARCKPCLKAQQEEAAEVRRLARLFHEDREAWSEACMVDAEKPPAITSQRPKRRRKVFGVPKWQIDADNWKRAQKR